MQYGGHSSPHRRDALKRDHLANALMRAIRSRDLPAADYALRSGADALLRSGALGSPEGGPLELAAGCPEMVTLLARYGAPVEDLITRQQGWATSLDVRLCGTVVRRATVFLRCGAPPAETLRWWTKSYLPDEVAAYRFVCDGAELRRDAPLAVADLVRLARGRLVIEID